MDLGNLGSWSMQYKAGQRRCARACKQTSPLDACYSAARSPWAMYDEESRHFTAAPAFASYSSSKFGLV